MKPGQKAIVAALAWKLENEGKERRTGTEGRSKKLELKATPLSQAAKEAGVAHGYGRATTAQCRR